MKLFDADTNSGMIRKISDWFGMNFNPKLSDEKNKLSHVDHVYFSAAHSHSHGHSHGQEHHEEHTGDAGHSHDHEHEGDEHHYAIGKFTSRS